METNEIRTLKILEELDTDHQPSQRDLAKTLGISLGLVNSFLKRLVHKGYFKATTIPKNRVRYILTPKGAAEKTRLTYEYIKRSYSFYKEARNRFRKLFEEFEKQRVKRVAFYGATDLAEIAYISLQQTDIELEGIIDDFKAGEKFMGNEILESNRLKGLHFDKLLISSMTSREMIQGRLLELGVSIDKIARPE